MKLHELAPKIAKKTRKRRGQGNGSGNGTFGGRGCKGQNARAGGGVRSGFEGGQSSLMMRLPKWRGFKNPNRVDAQIVNISVLELNFNDGEKVCAQGLMDKGLVRKNNSKIKVLGEGELTKKLIIEPGLLISAAAKSAIEKVGGTVAK
jgi:large subunit ribosomal protein L15